MKLGVLTAFRRQHRFYVRSCEELGVDHEVVDIISDGWYGRLRGSDCDGFLCRPPSKFAEWKAMYDERLWVLNRLLGRPVYPGLEELRLYENKRLSSYWLEHHGIPHPKTRVFYRKSEYMEHVARRAELPFVTKVSTGSTGKGVRIVRSRLAARIIGHLAFGVFNNKVAPGYSPPTTGRVIPFPAIGTFQRHHLLVQDFHPLRWEWRVVRIGESYFGHRKLLEGDCTSGSRRKGWVPPPEALLQLVRRICDTGGFRSMAVDIFETRDGEYLVNELQSIFGQSTDHLMYVDGRPGRYLFDNGRFRFQEGEFNRHRSFLLRVQDFIGLLEAEGPSR